MRQRISQPAGANCRLFAQRQWGCLMIDSYEMKLHKLSLTFVGLSNYRAEGSWLARPIVLLEQVSQRVQVQGLLPVFAFTLIPRLLISARTSPVKSARSAYSSAELLFQPGTDFPGQRRAPPVGGYGNRDVSSAETSGRDEIGVARVVYHIDRDAFCPGFPGDLQIGAVLVGGRHGHRRASRSPG